MVTVLLIEDDIELLNGLTAWLSANDFMVDVVTLGRAALEALNKSSYDVIVLDWRLPDISGLEVCRAYRKGYGETPIIFLTAMGDIDSKESALDAGADDYIPKPFDFRELSARIRSVLRRAHGVPRNLSAGGLTLEPRTRMVTDGTAKVRLTQREAALFQHLLHHPNKFFGAHDIREVVWPADGGKTDDTVRTCMKTLREKLDEFGKGDLIRTVPGAGYILEIN